MKTFCEIIKDLLPLYHDNVCSAQSRELVEEHIEECPNCAKLLSDLKYEMARPIDAIDEAKPIKAIQKAWKKDQTKSFIKGTVISLAACAVLVGAFVGLTQWYIPVPTSVITVSGVSELFDGAIGLKLTFTDGKDIRHFAYELIDGNLYLTPERAVISMAQPLKTGPVNRDIWFEASEIDSATACYLGTPKDRILIWQKGMELPPAEGRLQEKYEALVENVFVTNESDAVITTITVETKDKSERLDYGDADPIPYGDYIGLNFDAQKNCTFRVWATDEAKNIIAEGEFIKDVTYNAGEEIRFYIRDTADGNVYIADK